jgi:succinoglycan biosynthesis transport protein ExoP
MAQDDKFPGGQSAEVIDRPGALAPTGSRAATTVYLEPIDAPGGAQRDFFEYFSVALNRKYTILGVAALGGILAWGISSLQTPLYQARTDIEIQSMAESDLVYRIVDKDWQGGGGGNAVTPESYLETQLHILNSRLFQNRVLDKIRAAPAASSQYEPSRPRKLLSLIGIKLPGALGPGLPPIKCESKTVENTRIVQITCQSPNPDFAAEYANTTAREFIAYNLEAQSSTAEHTLSWLTNQLADMRNKVEQARVKLDQYSAASGVHFEANEPDTDKNTLGDLQKQLAAASVQQIDDQAAYEVALEASRANQLVDERLAGSAEEVLKLKSQLQQLSQQYTSDHPKVRQLKEQIETLDKIMAMQTATYVGILREKHEASKLREEHLGKALAQQSKVVLGAARKSTEYETLRREVERNQKLYEDLLQKATEVSLSTAMRGSSQIRVVDSAEPPAAPFRPAIPKTVGLGITTGLMLGFGLVFVGERTNHRFRGPGEVPLHLSLPELAVVPNYEPAARVAGKDGGETKRLPQIKRALGFGTPEPSTALMVLVPEKPGRVVESFRAAVTSLLAYRHWRNSSKTILVTSPSQGDGKSTVVSNLGISLAETGYSVVLVDGDIRRPHLNEIFGLANSWGLTTLVTGDNDIRTAPIEALVQKTKLDNLSLLTAGPGTSSISRILHAKRLEMVFDRLASEFDFVIVDSPPASEFSDARILGRLVDGAVLVIQCGETTREDASVVRDRLLQDNLTIIGAILNRWDGKATPSRYYSYGYREQA